MPNASSHEKASPSRALDNGYDFGIGRRLHNLPRLREIDFAANCRPSKLSTVRSPPAVHTPRARALPIRAFTRSRTPSSCSGNAHKPSRIAQFFTPTYNRLLRPGLANALSMRHLLTREAQFAG